MNYSNKTLRRRATRRQIEKSPFLKRNISRHWMANRRAPTNCPRSTWNQTMQSNKFATNKTKIPPPPPNAKHNYIRPNDQDFSMFSMSHQRPHPTNTTNQSRTPTRSRRSTNRSRNTLQSLRKYTLTQKQNIPHIKLRHYSAPILTTRHLRNIQRS